ncbi:MAG: CRISPR-associated endonuclease Cas1 [Aggregatilineales bacterium]
MTIVQDLYADQFGSHIGKYSERLKLTKGGETLAQAPLLHLESVTVASKGVSISADAIAACTERGIPIHFIAHNGESYASLYSAGLGATVLTRRAQLTAYYDERGCAISLAVVEGKILNQASTLKYVAKSRKEADPERYELLREASIGVEEQTVRLNELRGRSLEELRGTLMAIEGYAANLYWDALRAVIPDIYGWTARTGRGATDPVNSLLNYGYGILYGQIEQAIVLAGLDPFAGFIHTDRPGKPSLVLDLIEEFRQVAVDRLVVGLVNRNFEVKQDQQGRLEDETRRSFAEKILEHLDATVRYQGKRYPIRSVIQMQSRAMAAYLRGETGEYAPYKAEW